MVDLKKELSQEELQSMSVEELDRLIAKARAAGGFVQGTGVVRGKDGKIKYDDPSLKGTYHEGQGSSSDT